MLKPWPQLLRTVFNLQSYFSSCRFSEATLPLCSVLHSLRHLPCCRPGSHRPCLRATHQRQRRHQGRNRRWLRKQHLQCNLQWCNRHRASRSQARLSHRQQLRHLQLRQEFPVFELQSFRNPNTTLVNPL